MRLLLLLIGVSLNWASQLICPRIAYSPTLLHSACVCVCVWHYPSTSTRPSISSQWSEPLLIPREGTPPLSTFRWISPSIDPPTYKWSTSSLHISSSHLSAKFFSSLPSTSPLSAPNLPPPPFYPVFHLQDAPPSLQGMHTRFAHWLDQQWNNPGRRWRQKHRTLRQLSRASRAEHEAL